MATKSLRNNLGTTEETIFLNSSAKLVYNLP